LKMNIRRTSKQFFANKWAKNCLEVKKMIFQTLNEDYQHREPRKDYIEIKVRIPRYLIEKAIQEHLAPDF